jgi:hypothetical protein
MRLDEARNIVAAVDLLETFDVGHVSGSKIARQLSKLWSRATTYRKLKKCEDMGLLARLNTRDADDWFVCKRGYELLEAFNELPF